MFFTPKQSRITESSGSGELAQSPRKGPNLSDRIFSSTAREAFVRLSDIRRGLWEISRKRKRARLIHLRISQELN